MLKELKVWRITEKDLKNPFLIYDFIYKPIIVILDETYRLHRKPGQSRKKGELWTDTSTRELHYEYECDFIYPKGTVITNKFLEKFLVPGGILKRGNDLYINDKGLKAGIFCKLKMLWWKAEMYIINTVDNCHELPVNVGSCGKTSQELVSFLTMAWSSGL